MSTAAVTPPTSNANTSFLRHVPLLTERSKALLTELNLHFAGVALLVVLDLYLAAHLLFVWQGLNARDAASISQAHARMVAAELAAKPLRGLDRKLENSTVEANKFTQQRLPYAISEVAAELGALTKKQGVHLTRIQYAYSPVLSGNDALTEVRMDANVSGDYRPIVQFINAAERDKVFFVINSINLTGQQTGQVNLRIRLTTYLRSANPAEMTAEMPAPESQTGGKP